MSVTTVTNRLAFVGDGTDNSPYAISLPLRDTGSVEVIYVTDSTGVEVVKTIISDYTIVLATDFTSATLNIVGADSAARDAASPATGVTMVIRRNDPATRLTDYANFDGQPSSVMDSDYDLGSLVDQTLQEQLDRSILVAKGHPNANLPLTPLNLIGNADRVVTVNSAETGFELATGAVRVLDDETFCFGSDNDFCIAYDSAADALEIRNEGGTPLITIKDASNVFVKNSTFSGTLTVGGTLTVDGASTLTGNVAMGGTLVVTGTLASGALTVTGAVVASGILTVNSDTDGTTILGRAKIGSPTTDMAFFAHFDRLSSTDYAISQSTAGRTVINAATGQGINFAINNSEIFTITSTIVGIDVDLSLTGNSNLAVGGGSITSDSGAISFGDENLSTTGTLASGALTVGGTLTVNSDADGVTILGRVKIGTRGSGDVAIFAHFDHLTINGTALEQNSAGGTILNSVGPLQLAVDAISQITITSATVTIGSDNFVIQSGTLSVSGASTLTGDVAMGGTLSTSGLATLDSAAVTNNLTVAAGDVVVSTGDVDITAGHLGVGATAVSTIASRVVDNNTGVICFNVGKNVSAATVPVVQFVQNHVSGAVAVLKLQQDDISEGVIDIAGGAGIDRGAVPTSTVDSVASFRVVVDGTTYVVAGHVDQ